MRFHSVKNASIKKRNDHGLKQTLDGPNPLIIHRRLLSFDVALLWAFYLHSLRDKLRVQKNGVGPTHTRVGINAHRTGTQRIRLPEWPNQMGYDVTWSGSILQAKWSIIFHIHATRIATTTKLRLKNLSFKWPCNARVGSGSFYFLFFILFFLLLFLLARLFRLEGKRFIYGVEMSPGNLGLSNWQVYFVRVKPFYPS